MTIPPVETALPELMQLTADLADRHRNHAIGGWREYAQQVRAFFTPSMMSKVEQVVPGWRQMASHAEQQTLIHVTSVLTALHLLPEYQLATPEQQTITTWMVLFHDLAKIPQPGQHDYVHGFRSAALAGRGLAAAGFPVTESFADSIEAWFALTNYAVRFDPDWGESVPDNRKLPPIIAGIDGLYGVGAPAGMIVKGVLLHLSIATDPDYPTTAPLTDDEIRRYVDTSFFPLFKMLMLVDVDGWSLFDPPARQHYRSLTLAAFDRIATLIGAERGGAG